MDPASPNPAASPPAASPRRGRGIAWGIAAASLIAILVSITLLAREIRDYQRDSGRRQYYTRTIDATEFSLGGRPVLLREETDDLGRGEIVVTYAQDVLRLKVEIPNRHPLPLLARHEGWFRIVEWADGTGMNAVQFETARESGDLPTSVVIATRSLPPGAPPGGWGEVWRHQWVFNLYTLRPPSPDDPPGVGGGFAHERLEYPESPRAFARRTDAAVLRGEPPPQRNPRELREGTWQYEVAMRVMPKGSAPPHTFNRGVLMENRVLVAAASVSILTLLGGLAWALAPSGATLAQRRGAPFTRP